MHARPHETRIAQGQGLCASLLSAGFEIYSVGKSLKPCFQKFTAPESFYTHFRTGRPVAGNPRWVTPSRTVEGEIIDFRDLACAAAAAVNPRERRR
jgi:hypothetical protein